MSNGDYRDGRGEYSRNGNRNTGRPAQGRTGAGTGSRGTSQGRPTQGHPTQGRAPQGARPAQSRGPAGGRGQAQGGRPQQGGRPGASYNGRPAQGRPAPQGRRTSGGGRPPRKNNKRTIAIIVVELLVIALLGTLAYFVFIRTKVSNVTKVDLNEEEITQEIAEEVKENEAMQGYWNIALFGVDSTKGDLLKNTRSDSIIIASINKDTKEVKLCSVYRDTYLNIQREGKEVYDKCNAAYAYGGPEEAIKMLNTNLDMDITDFVTVGFGGLTEIIDDIGGVEIEVDDAEIQHINSYQYTMSQELHKEYKEVTTTGMQNLTGLQATAYCRIRYTAGNDFARAARQREVIQAIMNKAVSMDTNTLIDAANEIFDKQMATSLTFSEITDLLSTVSSYKIVGENGFPNEDMRATGKVGSASVVAAMDLQSNVVWLHQFLFDEEGYQVSDTVKSYSEKIAKDTAGLAH